MPQVFIQIGAESYVNPQRLLAVVAAESSPVRRIVQEARDRGALIDASSGKKTRSVLVMDSDHIICSAMRPEEIREQLAAVQEEEREDA